MSIDSIHDFIKGLEAHFTPPKHPTAESSKAWLTMMVSALHGASPEVLDRARIRIVETRSNRYFPLVAEIRKACREAADELKFNQYVETLPTLREEAGDDWSAERLKLAYDTLKTELGRQAAKEGWVLSFWHFVRKNQRVPKGPEIDQCKRDSAGIDEIVAACARGERGPCSKALANWGYDILNKREKLRAEAMGR